MNLLVHLSAGDKCWGVLLKILELKLIVSCYIHDRSSCILFCRLTSCVSKCLFRAYFSSVFTSPQVCKTLHNLSPVRYQLWHVLHMKTDVFLKDLSFWLYFLKKQFIKREEGMFLPPKIILHPFSWLMQIIEIIFLIHAIYCKLIKSFAVVEYLYVQNLGLH